MRPLKLGISIYPEKETKEEINSYLKTASSYGFTDIFTSVFSIEGSKEEIIAYFKELCELAHHYGMQVTGDCNPALLSKLGADSKNLSVFNEMGFDGLRMDMPYNDERDIELVNNPYGINIAFSASMLDTLRPLIGKVDHNRLRGCHNFYPQTYTGLSFDKFNSSVSFFKENDIDLEAFITSNADVKNTHGPWPVASGLVTIEDLRFLPIAEQASVMYELGANCITVGNAFASEKELKSVKERMDIYLQPKAEKLELAEGVSFPIKDRIHVIDFIPDKDMTESERDVLMNCPYHLDLGDGLNYMVRSRIGRIMYKDTAVPARKCEKEYFTKGDILIVNDKLEYYHNEIQIVLRDMKNTKERNLLGHIDQNSLVILDLIGPMELLKFVIRE